MGEFCNPSPQSKVTEAGADQTLLVPGTSQQAAEQEDAPRWASPEPAPMGHSQPGGSPGQGGLSHVLGQTQGQWLALTCLPAGSCSWEMAAVLLDGARPSQHQGMEAHTGIQLGLHQPGLCPAGPRQGGMCGSFLVC